MKPITSIQVKGAGDVHIDKNTLKSTTLMNTYLKCGVKSCTLNVELGKINCCNRTNVYSPTEVKIDNPLELTDVKAVDEANVHLHNVETDILHVDGAGASNVLLYPQNHTFKQLNINTIQNSNFFGGNNVVDILQFNTRGASNIKSLNVDNQAYGYSYDVSDINIKLTANAKPHNILKP